MQNFGEIGYKTNVKILNSVEYGIPQVRRRAFFVGNRIRADNPFPPSTHFDPLVERQLTLELKECLTIKDAISDLPQLQPGEGTDEAPYPVPGNLGDYAKTMREGSPMIYNHKARHHSDRDRYLFRLLREGQDMSDLPPSLRPYRYDIFHDKIKKQRWDRPSSTILAHLQKDGLDV